MSVEETSIEGTLASGGLLKPTLFKRPTYVITHIADQYAHAAMLLKEEHANNSGANCCSYSPIAPALSNLPYLENLKFV